MGTASSSTQFGSLIGGNVVKAKTKEQLRYLSRFKNTEYDTDDVNIFTRKLLRPRAFSIVPEEDDGGLPLVEQLRLRKSMAAHGEVEKEDDDYPAGDASTDCSRLQKEFRKGGWNVAGANLLAVTCWLSRENFLYVRPRLTTGDISVAALVTVTAGIIAGLVISTVAELGLVAEDVDGKGFGFGSAIGVSTTSIFIAAMSVMIGLISGGAVILRKLSLWQPVESVVKSMSKAKQKDFVDALLQVCQEESIDPENLYDLSRSAQRNGLSETGGRLNMAAMGFFRSRLKMQE